MFLINNHRKLFSIADYFIYKTKLANKEITNKKLQKLVYYAQAWYLVFNNKPLFDEKIEAWMYGPAVHCLYKKYEEFSFHNIKLENEIKLENLQLSKEDRKYLDKVWAAYGKFTEDELVSITHNELPWKEAREGVAPWEGSRNLINIKTMKQFYKDEQKKRQK